MKLDKKEFNEMTVDELCMCIKKTIEKMRDNLVNELAQGIGHELAHVAMGTEYDNNECKHSKKLE